MPVLVCICCTSWVKKWLLLLSFGICHRGVDVDEKLHDDYEVCQCRFGGGDVGGNDATDIVNLSTTGRMPPKMTMMTMMLPLLMMMMLVMMAVRLRDGDVDNDYDDAGDGVDAGGDGDDDDDFDDEEEEDRDADDDGSLCRRR